MEHKAIVARFLALSDELAKLKDNPDIKKHSQAINKEKKMASAKRWRERRQKAFDLFSALEKAHKLNEAYNLIK